jgi:CheY-like chemotaxis protein
MPAPDMPPVLVVGSFSDCEMYTEYLRSLGVTVVQGSTPEEAFAHLDTRRPAVIVTDMVFESSAYDGPAFIDALRARPDCVWTNVIVVSGFVRPEDRQRARVAGADLFLTKPCAPEALWRHVARAVGAHEQKMRADWNWPED